MTKLGKTGLMAIAALVLTGGAAAAAEMCACCKEGAQMSCCDKMNEGAQSAPGDGAPSQQHQH